MRKVLRDSVNRPTCLDFNDVSSKAYKELSNNSKMNKKKFKVYKDDSVKHALEKLFHGKCAYCETLYAVTQPVDVEHFRPKGKPHEYWWLAAVWENLLPSCIDCNRERQHKKSIHSLSNKLFKSGKQSHFPITNNKSIFVYSEKKINNSYLLQNLIAEGELLLNPCDDRYIEDLFEYCNNGVVYPSTSAKENPHLLIKVDETISVIGLNRPSLVFARKQMLLQLDLLIFIANKLSLLLKDVNLNSHHKVIIEEVIIYIFKNIKSYKSPKNPYSLMCENHISKNLDYIT
ncbi:hypothetical protein ABEH01_08375 [Pantoea agglomerans]|uniref:hypothetical protein n=1 Tax=Enterobacter agglomerans TaxID=549 RepID=UPI0032094B3E